MCRHINVYISHSLGKTDDAKASEKGKSPLKGSSLQRSPSDAGKSSGDEGKKPPSGIGRPTATGSFGFKKPSGVGCSAMVTSSGASITSGSATLGKSPRSAAPAGKSNAGRKTSLDGSQNQDDVGLHVSTKTSLQYRSLPRPSKSSASGIPGRGGHRSSTSSIDSNVSSKSAGATTSKLREPTKIGSGRSSPVTVNQTDKEKEKEDNFYQRQDFDTERTKKIFQMFPIVIGYSFLPCHL